MMKKLIIFTFFIFTLASFSHAEMPVKFFKEEINITLKKNSVNVRGLYFFESKSDFDEMKIKMFYPFPVDTSHLYPEKIKVLNPENPLEFNKKKDGIEWNLYFEPLGVETVLVEYKQKIKEKNATYILTTTKLWKQKIDKATFIIESPEEFKELNFSIKPDSVKSKAKKQFYYITRRYFLPKTDLKISWE